MFSPQYNRDLAALAGKPPIALQWRDRHLTHILSAGLSSTAVLRRGEPNRKLSRPKKTTVVFIAIPACLLRFFVACPQRFFLASAQMGHAYETRQRLAETGKSFREVSSLNLRALTLSRGLQKLRDCDKDRLPQRRTDWESEGWRYGLRDGRSRSSASCGIRC